MPRKYDSTPSQWLTTQQAAEYLHLHPETVREKIRRGELRAVHHGRTYRTRLSWCDDYMLSQPPAA